LTSVRLLHRQLQPTTCYFQPTTTQDHPMHSYHAHADPPHTLADRLHSLDYNLQAVAARLKDAIASAVSTTLGQAIRDAIRKLLGGPGQSTRPSDAFASYGRESRGSYEGLERRDEWARYDDDNLWGEDSYELVRPRSPSTSAASRWSNALRAAVQTALWWLRTRPCRKPLLTTAIVALSAGGVALFAGPTFAACVSVVASVAGLLLTADSARTAGELVAETTR
jgi:hypothetical protein